MTVLSENYRVEYDTIGPVNVPVDKLWGPQTQRCLTNFEIGDASIEAMPKEVVHALGFLKAACARVNLKFGRLTPEIAEAIIKASEEVAAGIHDDHFPLRWIQTGSGTQSNMNSNEVIARRASQILGGDNFKVEDKLLVHPNDHVNLGQSSNDVFPTAMHICVVRALVDYLRTPLENLVKTLNIKSNDWADIIKIGRTHLMDATPLTLGQEVSAWAHGAAESLSALEFSSPNVERCLKLAIGGTAVGTGLNTAVGFDSEVVSVLSKTLNIPFQVHPNKFAALSLKDGCSALHGELNTLASTLFKIAQDVRLLGSGPRCGLGELSLPANEPGSSIMPGKVNPTQCEAMTSICALVHGNNATISFAASQGHMQLNVFKPLMTATTLKSIKLLGGAIEKFNKECIMGMQVNEQRVEYLKNASLMLVTCLTPVIGYDAAGKAALHAHQTGATLKEVVVDQRKLMTSEDFDKEVDASKMLAPKLYTA